MEYGCPTAADKIFTDIEFLWIWLFQSCWTLLLSSVIYTSPYA